MKLLYIHQHFTTNEGTGGTRSYDVGRRLAAMGHQVTMVCGLGERSGLPAMDRRRRFAAHWMDGIKVVVCNVPYANRMGVAGRMKAFLRFALLAGIACLRERGVDLIFATSTPLTVGLPARVASALLRVPYVFEVRDLWPEDLLAAGRLRPGLQYRLWAWLERFSYTGAARVLLVSKGFHDRLLERGYPAGFLRTILLGADGGLFRDLRPDSDYVREHGLEGKTVAIYTGAHGDANGLTQVLDAAERLRDRSDIALVLLGDGGAKPALRQAAAERGLGNVHLLDPVVKTRLPNILAACHVGLMILKQITRPRWVTPNKLFDYMFAGLPTIVNFPGTTAELVVAEHAGAAVAPGSPDALADQIRRWADHPDEAAAIGRHAREVAFAEFDRERIAAQLAAVFEEVLTRRGRTDCAPQGRAGSRDAATPARLAAGPKGRAPEAENPPAKTLTMGTTQKPWTIGLFEPSDLDELLALHRACFGDRGDLSGSLGDRVRRADYPRTDVVVARDAGGRLVGTQAVTFLDGHLAGRAACIGMFAMGMVHPGYQGRGMFRELVESAERHGFAQGASVLFTMPNERSYPAFARFAAWHELPSRQPYLAPLNLRGVIGGFGRAGALLAPLAWPIDLAWRRARCRCPEVVEADLSRAGEELDGLAQRCGRRFGGAICLRDSRFLRWRFVDRALTPARLFCHRDAGGRLDGYIVTACRRVFGIETAFVVDLLADCNDQAVRAMLHHVAGEAADAGAGLMVSICLPPHHCRLMAQAGFVGISRVCPRRFHTFFARRPDVSDLPADLHKAKRWYLTLADFDTI